ncbi:MULTISPECIES: diguanylate cyclase [Aerosakkonema]|uniref:GGDEF domain-containing response regulator n=1 Tax=Aerosakkonema TaxID=1246629 RepID=UPI0035B8DB9E
MDASILVVGSDEFKTTLLERLRYLAACTVEFASSPMEALPTIQAQQPDVVILQASQVGSLELCRQIKQQTSLAWIYCILIAEQPQNAIEEILPGWNWELGLRAAALEGGADAYLWLLTNRGNGDISWEAGLTMQNHLLQAQVQAGIRRVQIDRNLMRTNDVLSAIALADPLTELSNRRALDWELPRQIQNARAREMPLSLLMLDVDYFKSINDSYGHLVGDRVLQLLSARLRHNLRFQDTPFRYGGEEFVILLSNTNPKEAQTVALRLNRSIANQRFGIDNNLALSVTVSIGIASLQPDDDTNGVSLLNRADRSLLRAKTNGRNQVICDGDRPINETSFEGNCEY